MNKVRVLQLGSEDYSKRIQVAADVKWLYEPDLSVEPDKDFNVVILGRGINHEELMMLEKHVRAYCVFVMDSVSLKQESEVWWLFQYKMGSILTQEQLADFLEHDISYYYSGSYGEKYQIANLAIAQGFQGKVLFQGFQGVRLEGDYGTEFTQIVFWRNSVPVAENQTIEFWLEYEKDPSVEISLEITQFISGSISAVQNTWTFSEKELDEIVYIENKKGMGQTFVSLKAKGSGKLTVVGLHDRHSRKGHGNFIPGGRRVVTSDREEVFYYFDPGNLKPPLNVYFSGYKTQEGFEGYYMMRKLEHPFLLITDTRLEGGGFYMGSEEYERLVTQVILTHMKTLNFDASQVILSGLSMGTFGALYYGCNIHPNTILIGKPLASIGDVAANERLIRPGGFPTSLDVLHKVTGDLNRECVQKLNDKFWKRFDETDWKGTRFAVAYMIEDDYDGTAYANLQAHLKNAGVQIYGKGLHGRHNDDTSGIVGWFSNQYRKILDTTDWNIALAEGEKKQV